MSDDDDDGPEQPSLFDVPSPVDPDKIPSEAGLAKGRARRDRGHAVVESHADTELREAVWHAANLACRHFQEVTSDEVWLVFEKHSTFNGAMPKRLNLMGAVMRKAQINGWLEPTGRSTKTRRADGHSRAIPIYRSRIYQGTQA